jgi:hypothetical protein
MNVKISDHGLNKVILFFSLILLPVQRSLIILWLRQYATSRKVAGSRPDEVNDFLQFT